MAADTHVWASLLSLVNEHGQAVLVTIASIKGSTPREAGARMVIAPDGSFSGTIGGGALEWDAINHAKEMAQNGEPFTDWRLVPLGPNLGQCCGGSVKLLYELFTSQCMDELHVLAEREQSGPFMTRAVLDGITIKRQIVEGETDHSSAQVTVTDNQLVERFGVRQHPILIFGAGHVARALMLALAPLPFQVTWVDPRDDAFPSVMPANFTAQQTDDFESVIAAAPDGAYILVMTHDHALDENIVRLALTAERFGYVGVIGSKTKAARFQSRLRKSGLSDQQLDNMICPIGLVELKSKRPEIIAAGIAAELLTYLTAEFVV